MSYTHRLPYSGSILSFPGGTPFGNYDELGTGRYTPMYSVDFIDSQLESNVDSLVQWENTDELFKLYAIVLNEIQESAASEEAFTAEAIDVLLQVQNVSTSVSTESSYTEGEKMLMLFLSKCPYILSHFHCLYL